MLALLSKLFGSKSNRDIKLIQPLVEKTKEEYAKLHSLSNDELRQRTIDFKARIQAFLEEIDKEIAVVKTKAESEDLPINEKTALYDQLDKMQKDRDKELEKVLMEILPEAFAVMKDTARRFTENTTIEVTATQADRELAARKKNVVIQGDKAIHHNTWLAAGTEVTWNMIHYDVQLIGGIVLHQGKIAE
ncbi:MAG: preprotein translocase subunit SecA, partial [Daejeonella sp.]|nr:preprotein translocase subunit SecA [Daejeonella sp.]